MSKRSWKSCTKMPWFALVLAIFQTASKNIPKKTGFCSNFWRKRAPIQTWWHNLITAYSAPKSRALPSSHFVFLHFSRKSRFVVHFELRENGKLDHFLLVITYSVHTMSLVSVRRLVVVRGVLFLASLTQCPKLLQGCFASPEPQQHNNQRRNMFTNPPRSQYVEVGIS